MKTGWYEVNQSREEVQNATFGFTDLKKGDKVYLCEAYEIHQEIYRDLVNDKLLGSDISSFTCALGDYEVLELKQVPKKCIEAEEAELKEKPVEKKGKGQEKGNSQNPVV